MGRHELGIGTQSSRSIALESEIDNPSALRYLQSKLSQRDVDLIAPKALHMRWFSFGNTEQLRRAVARANPYLGENKFISYLVEHLLQAKERVEELRTGPVVVRGEELQLYGISGMGRKPYWALSVNIPQTVVDYTDEMVVMAEGFFRRCGVLDPFAFMRSYGPTRNFGSNEFDPHISLARPRKVVNPPIQPSDSIRVVLRPPTIKGDLVIAAHEAMPTKYVA